MYMYGVDYSDGFFQYHTVLCNLAAAQNCSLTDFVLKEHVLPKFTGEVLDISVKATQENMLLILIFWLC